MAMSMDIPEPSTSAANGSTKAHPYNHQSYWLRRRICKFLLRTIAFTMLARVERVEGQEYVPQSGPAILMINHIAFIDPLVLVHISPRDIVPMAKEEAYHYPIIGIFPRIWGVIPVKREGADRRAIQRALEVLAAGEIVLVAPEGTRNKSMQAAKEGAAYLASRSGAPIIPTAIQSTVGFPSHPFSARWRQPGAHIRYGPPILYKPEYRKAKGQELRLMADEAMYKLAPLLAPELRGYYADYHQVVFRTIQDSP